VSADEPTLHHHDVILGQLDPDADMGFGKDSTLRKVVSEPVCGLFAQRALVMDVAHPKVGAGVRDHSRFQHLPVRRLWGTMDLGTQLVFGDVDISRAAARRIYAFHDHVNGHVAEPPVPDDDAHRYTAHDATLLRWVWATIIDSVEVAFTRWVRPFADGEADAFYADACSFARFFGIPAELLPPDRGAFAEYLDEVLSSDLLGSTPTSQAMVHDVLWHPMVPGPLARTPRVMAIGLLDPRLAKRLDLELSPADQRLFDRLDRRLARWYHRLPAVRTKGIDAYLFLRRPTIGLKERLTPGR
jgi:uncharacterized protein (DUF2236 family)